MKMAKTRRTRMSAENDHRRVTRPRLRTFVKETRGYPTGYLRAQSDAVKYDRESRKVGYGFSIILDGLWLRTAICVYTQTTPNSEELQHEGRAHDHYLDETAVLKRLRGGVRWCIRTGARRKSSEQRRCLSL